MQVEKSVKREKKQFKKKHGMRISNKSVFLLASLWTGKKKRKRRKKQ